MFQLYFTNHKFSLLYNKTRNKILKPFYFKSISLLQALVDRSKMFDYLKDTSDFEVEVRKAAMQLLNIIEGKRTKNLVNVFSLDEVDEEYQDVEYAILRCFLNCMLCDKYSHSSSLSVSP